jgi:acyl-CoA thioesterase
VVRSATTSDAGGEARLFGDTLALLGGGANLWTGEADRAWAHPGGRFGGWTAAMLLRAAMLEPRGEGPERGAPLSLTVLFTDAVRDGPIELSTRQLRAGQRLQFWRTELRQGDKVCAHAQATFGVRRETVSFTDAMMPEALPPEDPSFSARAPVRGPGWPLDQLWLTPEPWSGPKGGPARSVFWARSAAGHALDHALLATLADFGPPRVFYRRPAFQPSSTVSMSVYFHATGPEIAACGADWVLHEIDCRRCEGGYYDHQVKIWSRSGALLATSEQVAAFRD